MKKNLNRNGLVLLLLVLVLCCIQSFPIYAERYPKGSPHIKSYEYLIEEYGLSQDQFQKIMYRIMNDYDFERMKRAKQDHAFVASIMQAVKETVGDLKDSHLTHLEKALLAHDRLAIRSEYDRDSCGDCDGNVCSTTNSNFAFSSYGPLVNRKGVCQGYAEAYVILMTYLGVDCDFVSSEQANHAWNVLTIDGVKYYVDVTHDDPLPNRPGQARHTHFLMSGPAYQAKWLPYTIDDFDLSLNDTRYDNAFWRNAESPFFYIDGKIYFFDEKAVSINQFENGESVSLFKPDDVWKTGPNGTFVNKFFCLASDEHKLYYNDSTHIYEFDPVSITSKIVWTPPLNTSIYESIEEFTAEDGSFQLTLQHFPLSGKPEWKRRTITGKNPDPEVYFKDYPKKIPSVADSVKFCLENRFLSETEHRKLGLSTPVNRAQLVTILWRMAGSPNSNQELGFQDLKSDWYKQAVTWAVENEIVSGMDETRFEPNQKISKQDLIVILYRFEEYLEEKHLKFSKKEKDSKDQIYVLKKERGKAGAKKAVSSKKEEKRLSHYQDVSDIGPWALDAILWAEESGIMPEQIGNPKNFSPKSDVTREQMAVLLKNYIIMRR